MVGALSVEGGESRSGMRRVAHAESKWETASALEGEERVLSQSGSKSKEGVVPSGGPTGEASEGSQIW